MGLIPNWFGSVRQFLNGFIESCKSGGVFAAELPEQAGVNQKFTERRCEQATEDDRGHGVENFAARFLATEYQRDQTDAGRECRHQHGSKPFETATQHHLSAEVLTLLFHQVEVVCHQQDAIPHGDSAERYEAHQTGHRQ